MSSGGHVVEKREHLPGRVQVKGTMLLAHLDWLSKATREPGTALLPDLPPDCQQLIAPGILATEWIRLAQLITIDRAIAKRSGRRPDEVFRELGHHSALANLAGVYRSYVAGEPHDFFERGARLHGRFQDFGHSVYERVGERSGRIRLEEYVEYSPVYCLSAVGYYQGALETMHVPGPIGVRETTCTCAGDPACGFELSW
jgi:predicted hydrocarbon binding protein